MATIDYFVNANNTTTGNGLTREDNGTYWAVSFDGGSGSDPTGSTVDVSTDTGIVGTVEKVILGSGSWGVDAAGILILSSKAGVFANNQELQLQGTSTKVCDTNISGTAAEFWSNQNEDAGAYTAFTEMETDQSSYTDRSSDDVKIWFSGSNTGAGDTTNGQEVASWTAYNSVLMCGDDGSADGIEAYNGEGWNTTNDYSTSFYHMIETDSKTLVNRISDITYRGLQIRQTGVSAQAALIMIRYAALSNVAFENNWILNDGGGPISSEGTSTCTGISLDGNYVRAEHENDYTVCVNLTGGIVTFSSVSNNVIEYIGSTSQIDGINLASGDTLTTFHNNIIYGFTPAGNNDNIVNNGTITAHGTNATEDDQSDAEITVIISTTAGVDAVDPENSDFRPQSAGLLDLDGTTGKAPTLDITGATFSNDNIGCFNEIVGAGADAISKIVGVAYSGVSKVNGVAKASFAKISGVTV